ncbi:MAG: YifB family Mg chelatase-like AAA ATPase [Heliobacteriaceae bacterium]|nr:YifB family Mg chelatase-like AAA ATPase [Heliobacteriaceae bacterium]MDD4587056.1 YifB family Mg chelatase-like AAA ATPase [Heliobacteriaceae bacterium]
MLAQVNSLALEGLVAQTIQVEVDVAKGLPAFDLVGLPATAVREARERVRSAIRNSGFEFPLQRITVNLAPANVRKEGSGLDVAIALGILAATGQIETGLLAGWYFVGELALDGSLRRVDGVLAMAWGLVQQQRDPAIGPVRFLVPSRNQAEAARIEQIATFGGQNLRAVAEGLTKGIFPPVGLGERTDQVECLEQEGPDLAHIQGQPLAKRALEIAAAGGHNLVMVGPPGTGKTLLARSLPSIMPPLTTQEALEATMIHSVAGALANGVSWIQSRPFRTPHHFTTLAALLGGGRPPRPGEISLAHHGILFMDEWPEFSREALEGLRQPLEDGWLTLSRVGGTVTYPARFMLLASMNPCLCGFAGDPENECRCTPLAIERYHNRISGPLWDRMDLQVAVFRPEYGLLRQESPGGETSAVVQERVITARKRQLRRLRQVGRFRQVYANGQLTAEMVRETCPLDVKAETLLQSAYDRLGLSGRGLYRTIKVARTIADLRGADLIEGPDIAEALQYRLP